jgi:hypothetical protein
LLPAFQSTIQASLFAFPKTLRLLSLSFMRRTVPFLAVVLAVELVFGTSHAETRITNAAYHGWDEALTMSNGKIDVIIVPAIGRIMRFTGEQDGPFWENRALDGKMPDSQSAEWINFGGDKSWPAPQSEWAKITGRGWPPPKAFDSMPVEAKTEGEQVVLRSRIDPDYGIQVERKIRLSRDREEMEIETVYHKKQGNPVRVSVWIITQLKDPVKVYMPVPVKSVFPDGYNKQSEALPEALQITEGVITCRRSKSLNTKIGSDSDRIIWADAKHVVEVYSPRDDSGEYPDNGSSAEIYTNSDPLTYVELELLGTLKTLKPGETLSQTQRYRFYRRNEQPLDQQVRGILTH